MTTATGEHDEIQRDEYDNIQRCNLLFTPLCLFCMDCGVLEIYISASKASHYAVDIVSVGLPLVAKLLYGISLSHDKMKLTGKYQETAKCGTISLFLVIILLL